MRPAQRLAYVRLAYAAAAVLLPVAVGGLARLAFARSDAAVAAVGLLSVAAGAVLFLWAVFRWRPRCPRCGGGEARFVWRDGKEHLECGGCGFDELTGWGYD